MAAPQNHTSNRWPKYALVFVAGLVVGLLGYKLASGVSKDAHPRSTAANAVATTLPSRPLLKRDIGPWGTLDALRIPLEDPADFFPDRKIRLQPARWFFERYNETSLSNFFNGCDLTTAEKAELQNASRWQVSSNGCVVAPSAKIVRDLSASARDQIYQALAKSSQNYSQQYPFRFRPEDLPERFAESRLPAERLQAVRQLLYTNAGTICFSDVELLPSMLSSNEFEATIEALYAIPSYRLRLIIFPNSDIEPVLRYWARENNADRLRPLLESLTRLQDTNGTSLNVSYLLPAFARLRLYTFPKEWRDTLAAKEDCFWTSMNFFNDEPDKKFLDPNVVRTVLQSDYAPVKGPPTYGDLITIVGPSGDGRHMCVYLADGFVYTKNGMNPLSPWVLMRLPDMLAVFTSSDQQRMVVMRRKELPATGHDPGNAG